MTDFAPPIAGPIPGHPRAWARDLAALGATTSVSLSLLFWAGVPRGFTPLVGFFTVLSGGLIGRCMPRVLDAVRGRVPIGALVLAAPVVGGLWGGLSGGLAGLLTEPRSGPVLGLLAGGLAGAAQFGWFWLPYTVQTVRRKPTWPLLVASVFALPAIAVATLLGGSSLLRLHAWWVLGHHH